MDTHEIAWAAGFFDGEGHTAYRRKDYSLRMEVGQKNRELLDRFQAAVGGLGRIYLCEKKSRAYPDRAYWSWYLCGQENIRAVYSTLRPYLGRIKSEQAEKAISARVETYANNWGDNPTQCRKGHNLTLPGALMEYDTRAQHVRRCAACFKTNQENYRAKKKAAS